MNSLATCGVLAALAWSSVAIAGGSSEHPNQREAMPADQAAETTGQTDHDLDDAQLPSADQQLEWPEHIMGPRLVDLGHSSEIDLPDGIMLLERAEAQDMIRQDGGDPEAVLAILTTTSSTWMVVIEYDGDLGYISDADADELDADEMIASYREGARLQNARRKQLGLPGLIVDRWSEDPRYERASHHLVWGLAGHDETGEQFINHFTRILGRSGYLSFNLIDAPSRIEASKREVAKLLDALRFKSGSRYQDYRPGDPSSGAGLKTLVLGGAGVAAASKMGLFAKLLVLLKKLGVFIVIGFGALFKWLRGRNRNDGLPPSSSSSSGASSDLSSPPAT
ncbi:MAG: DUF2167 domain-containing protein [Kofleriaceae bacterium]